MKGIVLFLENVDILKVEMPKGLSKSEVDNCFNEISKAYFNEASNNAPSMHTWNEDEVNSIANTNKAIAATRRLIHAIGLPVNNPNWVNKFWEEYSRANPLISCLLDELRKDQSEEVRQELAKYNLIWLLTYITGKR